MKTTSLRIIILVVMWLTANLAFAEIPSTMNFQGFLTDSGGNPIEGSASIVFTIYDQPAEGNAIWTETLDVDVQAGVISVFLGATNPLDANVFDGESEHWLGLQLGSDDEMVPRHAIGSVPYAVRSSFAENVPSNEELLDMIEADGSFAPKSELVDQDPATSPVHWNDLLDTPSDLGGLSEDDVLQLLIDGGYLTAADLVDYYTASEIDGSFAQKSHTHFWSEITDVPANCEDGEVLKWNGTAMMWECNIDIEGDPSTVYGATAGRGLELTGNDFGLISTCAGGQVLEWNGTTEVWECNDCCSEAVTYSAGDGISIAGEVISSTLGVTIDTTEIVNDAVTSDKLADNSVAVNHLADMNCGNNELLKWNDTSGVWQCRTDEEGSGEPGDITKVTAGVGLDGGGSTGDVTINADITYLQRRADGECTSGKFMTGMNENGTPICDDETVYDSACPAGQKVDELTSGGGVLCSEDLNTTYDKTCPAGEKVSAIDAAGNVTCSTDLTGSAALRYQYTVAKSGGDYTSVQAAIDDLDACTSTAPCYIKIAPGIYEETVTINNDYIFLHGSGIGVTTISSDNSIGSFSGSGGVVHIDSNANNALLRDMTITNTGTGSVVVGLSVGNTGNTSTVQNIEILVASGATNAYGIGALGTQSLSLKNVQVRAAASDATYAAYLADDIDVEIHGGEFIVGGGANAASIFVTGSGTTLKANDVEAKALNADSTNTALYVTLGADVTLQACKFSVASSDGKTTGIADNTAIKCNHNSTTSYLKATAVTAISEGGEDGWGLYNDHCDTELYGGLFKATASDRSYGIYNYEGALSATGITVKGLAGSSTTDTYGMKNESTNDVTITGSIFESRGGDTGYGIYNTGLDGEMILTSSKVEASGSSSTNFGYQNRAGDSKLQAVTIFAIGGSTASTGLGNSGGSTLLADGVASFASSDDANNCYGLNNTTESVAKVSNCTFSASTSGNYAYGVRNSEENSKLLAYGTTFSAVGGGAQNIGANNINDATAELRNCIVLSEGPNNVSSNSGINNTSTIIISETDVKAINGASRALDNNKVVRITGGSFYAYATSTISQGIYNKGVNADLRISGATVTGEGGSTYSYGLYNGNEAYTYAKNCSFIAMAGGTGRGIYNYSTGTELIAENVVSTAKNNSQSNIGISSNVEAELTLKNGILSGHGGTNAYGLKADGGTTVEISGATVLAEDGSVNNFGIQITDGSSDVEVTMSEISGASNSAMNLSTATLNIRNSRLVGTTSGTITCTLVTRGTNVSTDGTTCP